MSEPEKETSPGRGRARHGIFKPRYALIALAVIAAAGFGAREVHLRMTHVHEEDARVTAEVVTIASRTDGWLTDVAIEEGEIVESDQVLAQVDDRVARLRANALEARIAGLSAERERLFSQRRMIESRTSSRIESRQSTISAMQAKRSTLLTQLDLARTELDRMRELHEREVVPRSRLDQAESRVRALESDVVAAEAEIAEARGAMREAEAGGVEVDVIDQEIARLEHEEAELRAELAQHLVDVEDRSVRAPGRGIIDRIFVERGEYVSAGQRILQMHDPDDVWIEANIKETQLRRLRRGQPVDVRVDAFPGVDFRGTVARIGSSTTAQFALLPTPNPSGNFTKITQRVPVKITFDDLPMSLAPGMMVVVRIDVRD